MQKCENCNKMILLLSRIKDILARGSYMMTMNDLEEIAMDYQWGIDLIKEKMKEIFPDEGQ